MIAVVLADDHDIVRQGLRILVNMDPTMHVVAEASDGASALAAVEQHRPDVLVLDLMFPGMAGLEVIRHAVELAPELRIVMLSMHAELAYVTAAIDAGASAYVTKSSDSGELLAAIRSVMDGDIHIAPPLSMKAVTEYRRSAAGTGSGVSALTPREIEITRLVAEGNSTAAIAFALSISIRTVDTHRANVMRKLRLRGQADLVRFAIRSGIAPLVHRSEDELGVDDPA